MALAEDQGVSKLVLATDSGQEWKPEYFGVDAILRDG